MKSTKVIIPVAASILGLMSLSFAETRTFYATEDAWVAPLSPDTNYGNDAKLAIQYLENPSYPYDEWEWESYIKFDLSSIAGITIESVTLELYCFQESGNTLPQLRQVTSSWNESTLTYNNKPTRHTRDLAHWDNVSVGWLETNDSVPFGDYDLGRVVQEWVDGTSVNYGIMLFTDDTLYDYAYFGSSEYYDDAQRPVLIVNYNSPPSKPINPNPLDGATGVGLEPTLTWEASTDPDGDELEYDVYFDTSSPPLWRRTVTTPSYYPKDDVGTLNPSTPYYWRIVAKDRRCPSDS